MFIALRHKTTTATTTSELPSSEEKPAANLDDLELADSDREDYHNNVDILFVLDTTSSMGQYIQQSKTTIKKIIERFSKMEFNMKFSLCAYRDHPPQDHTYVTKFNDLVSGKQLIEILNATQPQGGGDGPEAVMDGLKVGLSQTSWRLSEDNVTQSKRFVFHICDAPPHGQEFGGQSTDKNWQSNGCPCGTKTEDINKLLKEHTVDYHLIKATKQLDKMEAIFKESFGENFSPTILLENNFESNKKVNSAVKTSTCVADVRADGDREDGEKEKSKHHIFASSEAAAEKRSSKKEYTNMWDGIVDALDTKLL